MIFRQTNSVRAKPEGTQSYQMGLSSIRRIAHNYAGRVEVVQDDASFEITITLSDF